MVIAGTACFGALSSFDCCSTSPRGNSHGLGRQGNAQPLFASFWSWLCSNPIKLWDGAWFSSLLSGWYGSIRVCRVCGSEAIISVFSIRSAAF